MATIIEQLARFATDTRFEDLPPDVVDECRRIVLDSMGCALAATEHPKGRIGIEYARVLGGQGNATVIGTTDRLGIVGAAFANGELINALDMDAVLPPGHVTPYVLPGVMAIGETLGATGQEVIRSLAVAHEMSWRMGKAMDYLRDTKDGKMSTPPIFGYSSTIFGATAAMGMLQGQTVDVLANSLGVAGCIPPAQSQMMFFDHAPSTTIKYLMAGALVQAAMTAAHMGLYGHRGDVRILDNAELGFPRFIGTRRWLPEKITDGLGTRWGFTSEQAYKPYPHCRILHAPLDCLIGIVEKHDIQPHEIDGIKVLVEGFVERPVWLTREIKEVHDAQFSIAHGMAMGAHRLKPGKEWQDPKVVFSDSVMGLMNKVTHEVHPDYVKELSAHGSARPTRVEVQARGQTFVAEARYPKGSPSPDPASRMTTEEVVGKFCHNAQDVINAAQMDRVVNEVLALEKVADFSGVMKRVARSA